MPLRRIGVGELARRAHVSRGYLNRLIRAGFGLSAAAALERARCARAESLLLRTDLTVESIAHQCGFADPSHFSHRFKAIHGASPRRLPDGGHHTILGARPCRRPPAEPPHLVVAATVRPATAENAPAPADARRGGRRHRAR